MSKKKYFVDMPRHRRSELVIGIKNKIRESGTHFWTCQVMDASQWVDCYFLSKKDRFSFYNVCIRTAKDAFLELVRDEAGEKALALLTKEKTENIFRHETVPCKWDSLGHPTLYRMFFPKPERFTEFGGLTYWEYVEKLEKEIIQTAPPAVYEEFSFDIEYRYGIGLHIIVDEEAITTEILNKVIERFWAMGERSWMASEPVQNLEP